MMSLQANKTNQVAQTNELHNMVNYVLITGMLWLIITYLLLDELHNLINYRAGGARRRLITY